MGRSSSIELETKVRFKSDGTFKIVQFNDYHDDDEIEPRTIQLIERALDAEQPDLVVLNGDNISMSADIKEKVEKAISHIVKPMENRKISWVITFGNHDVDGGVNKDTMLGIYCSYTHNLNKSEHIEISGTGNMNLLIGDDTGNNPKFNLWLFDSGTNAPSEIAGQKIEGYTHAWVKNDQITWYYETSKALEQKYGKKIPSLAFIHIPLWEFRHMYFDSVDGLNPDHERAKAKYGISGDRFEDECPGHFNSGLYTAILERGDVKGVFCGHDHANDYSGNYYGIILGYSGSSGFGAYGVREGMHPDGPHALRCIRVHNLTVTDTDVEVKSRIVRAKEYGIDLTTN